MFALSFIECRVPSGTRYEACGPFYVSASRKQITVHFCQFTDKLSLDLFRSAMGFAYEAMVELQKEST